MCCTVLKDRICRRVSFFWNGNRTRVEKYIAFFLLCFQYMGMSMDQNISFLDRRQIIFIVNMPMCGIKGSSIQIQDAVVCHNRKLQDHLIDLSFTIPTYSINFFLHVIKHGNDLFGSIFSGKIISRAMIEQIAQQYQAFCLFFFIGIQHFSAVVCRTMDI